MLNPSSSVYSGIGLYSGMCGCGMCTEPSSGLDSGEEAMTILETEIFAGCGVGLCGLCRWKYTYSTHVTVLYSEHRIELRDRINPNPNPNPNLNLNINKSYCT